MPNDDSFHKLQLFYPTFERYCVPTGHLSREIPCQALFYYNIIARNAYEENVLGHGLQYEHVDYTNTSNFRTIFESVAILYGVAPESMVPYWSLVDQQCEHLGIPVLPAEERYRFNQPGSARSN